MALRDALLIGLAVVVVANAMLHWYAAPPTRRRPPLIIALFLASIVVAASTMMLVDASVLAPLSVTEYSILAAAVFGAVLVVAAALSRVPWSRAWPIPLVVLAGFFLVRSVPAPTLLVTAIALVVGITGAPALAAAWEKRGAAAWGAIAIGLLLLLGGLGGALALLFGIGDGTFGDPAVHRATIALEPESPGAYVVILTPFDATEADAQAPLDAFLATARVIEGNAHVVIVGDRLRIEGEGRAVIVLDRSFLGPGREAFTHWTFADDGLRVTGVAVTATIAFDLSGGTGHTCWMQGERSMRAAPDGTASAEPTDGRPSTICA